MCDCAPESLHQHNSSACSCQSSQNGTDCCVVSLSHTASLVPDMLAVTARDAKAVQPWQAVKDGIRDQFECLTLPTAYAA